MDEQVRMISEALTAGDDDLAVSMAGELDWLILTSTDTVGELLAGIAAQLENDVPLSQRLLGAVLRHLASRSYHPENRASTHLDEFSRSAAMAIYDRLGTQSAIRHWLLQMLAGSRTEADIREFAERMVADPPADPTAVAIAFTPLFQRDAEEAAAAFPRLLDALAHPGVAPFVLDLANFVTREGLVELHPAAARRQQLVAALGAMVQRLGMAEESPEKVAQDERQLAAMIAHSVGVAVSLCDALALIGDEGAIGKLNQALELRHRRLRTEAAAALARLGDENGRQVLISLAAEPVARLRVLAYAEELGIEDQLDERFTTGAARAESELALWLAQPSQIGFPPSRLELVDTETLYWPGYDEPVECFLFRFFYETSEREYSNIAIAGPVCHAFAADLADLPPSDIYAIFAGWQAEHEEIYEYDVNQLTESRRVDVTRLERRLHDEGYEAVQAVTFGVFFGEKVLVARAKREGQPGIVVASLEEIEWYGTPSRRNPLGPAEVYFLFKGRRLLRTFNP